jgi:ABC-2 type transport system permease protein
MSTGLNQWRVLKTLVWREFAEQRLIFVYLPLGITVMFIVMNCVRMLPDFNSGNLPGYEPMAVSSYLEVSTGYRMGVLRVQYVAPLGFTLAAYSLAMCFYFLTTLYQQRKNRNILFWNSMPVSDAQAVVSKLVAAALCYGFYLVCVVAQAAFMIAIAVVFGWYADLDGWNLFVALFDPVGQLAQLAARAPIDLLWFLPAYAWLLLASAVARQAPFVWAVGPLLVVAILELVVSSGDVLLFESALLAAFQEHALPVMFREPYRGYPPGEILAGVVLGVALIAAAIRFNHKDAH